METETHARTGPRHQEGAPAGDALHGRLLDGRYRIGHRIARGGMASVYEAVDVRLDRTVAVKVMHAGLSDGAFGTDAEDPERDFAARFVREARAAAALSHPNVVAVYDQGEDDGAVYLAMELVPGRTLRDTVLDESPLPPARAVALLEPVLSALAAAHRAGLVHRDVKPENVLLADDGRVKVADFGLARAVSADTRHTATQGVLIGTVSYLAPELVVDGRADARADVYAVGVLLYELLTGVKPHQGETPIQVAYRHVNRDVPPPSERVPGLPAYVDALVARATSRDRDQRPADAAVLLHQLHRVGHALAQGVQEDPELTQDLALLPTSAGGETEPISGLRSTWDPAYEPAPQPAAPRRAPAPDSASGPVSSRVPGPPRPVAQAAGGARPRRSRRLPLLLALALLIALAVGGGAFWFGWARYSPAPSVVGMGKAEAVRTLEDAGLTVELDRAVYDSENPKGTVLDAEPAGGARVLDGETVTLTLSLGRLLAPKVAGMAEDAAQDALLERRLELGRSIRRFSETQPEGTVLRSRPRAGTEMEPGQTVDLVVSKGRRPIQVGSWAGDEIDDVRTALEKRGLEIDVTSEQFHDTVPDGHVISQDPQDGTLFKGDEVSFVVSKGPELVDVPSVKAFGVDAARDRLEGLGFDVDVQESDQYLGLGFVVSTDPEGGSRAPKGSTITLSVI